MSSLPLVFVTLLVLSARLGFCRVTRGSTLLAALRWWEGRAQVSLAFDFASQLRDQGLRMEDDVRYIHALN